MIPIDKQTEPHELTEYRLSGGTYDDLDAATKSAVRDRLLSEQGFLCAYCMGRITKDKMKIEHWHCQSTYPGEQLSYGNLLGCCMGGEGCSRSGQHCDTHKADTELTYNPARAQDHPHLGIRYTTRGMISADNTQFNAQINDVLNLNYVRLTENRKAVIRDTQKLLGMKAGRVSKAELTRLLDRCMTRDSNEQLVEYCGVVQYYLKKRLKALA